jgi:hypothetical protein
MRIVKASEAKYLQQLAYAAQPREGDAFGDAESPRQKGSDHQQGRADPAPTQESTMCSVLKFPFYKKGWIAKQDGVVLCVAQYLINGHAFYM